MTPDIVLQVNGEDYGGWLDVQVDLSIEQLSGAFRVSHTERWADSDQRRPIAPGAQCSLSANGVPLINGYVDDVQPNYDARQHQLVVVGRDKTADIIDSSAEIKEFKNQKLDAIAKALSKPHDVNVIVDADVGEPFKKQTVNPGETVYEVIERLARHRGLLLINDGGDLKITTPGTEVIATKLELGQNILRAAPRFSHRDRFAQYTVLSQTPGDDQTWTTSGTPQGLATDTIIRSTRKKLIIAEEPSTISNCNKRARWEANISAGRGSQIVYTVEGWFHDGKALWPINKLVPVKDDFLGIDQNLLITGVTFSLSEEGVLTEITVMPPAAFQLIPIPEDKVLSWS